MSDSVRPHGRQPNRLCHPWDSPGKNTGVGCHFLLQCKKVKSESEVAQSCLTLRDPRDCSLPGSSRPWDFPGKSTGVGCHCLLQSFLLIKAKFFACALDSFHSVFSGHFPEDYSLVLSINLFQIFSLWILLNSFKQSQFFFLLLKKTKQNPS